MDAARSREARRRRTDRGGSASGVFGVGRPGVAGRGRAALVFAWLGQPTVDVPRVGRARSGARRTARGCAQLGQPGRVPARRAADMGFALSIGAARRGARAVLGSTRCAAPSTTRT